MRRGIPVKGHVVYPADVTYHVTEQELISGEIGMDWSDTPTAVERLSELRKLLKEDRE